MLKRELLKSLWKNKEDIVMLWLWIVLGVVGLVLLIVFLLCSYTKAGPDEAIMISGLGRRKIWLTGANKIYSKS